MKITLYSLFFIGVLLFSIKDNFQGNFFYYWMCFAYFVGLTVIFAIILYKEFKPINKE